MDTNQLDITRPKRVKNLLDEVHELENNVDVLSKMEVLKCASTIISSSTELLREVKPQQRIPNSSELVTDARLIASTARLQSEVMWRNNELNENIYVEAMQKRLLKDGKYDWNDMIKDVCQSSKSLSIMSSTWGAQPEKPLEQKISKERKPRQTTVLAEETEPESIEKLERKDKGNEKAEIALRQITELLRRGNSQPIPFYKLVLDPTSFGRTVMNMFMMSFLIKEHSIRIDKNEHDIPVVRLNDKKKDESANKQAICRINPPEWEELLRKYEVTEAMLNLDA